MGYVNEIQEALPTKVDVEKMDTIEKLIR